MENSQKTPGNKACKPLFVKKLRFLRISLDNFTRLRIFLPSKSTDIRSRNFDSAGLINLGKAYSVAKKTVKKAKSKATKTPASKKKSAVAKTKTGVSGSSSFAKKSGPKILRTKKNAASKPGLSAPSSAPKSRRPRKTNEAPLTAAELEHFRELLMEKLREIVGDVNHIENEALRKSRTEAAGDLSTMPIHMADIGSDNFEQEFALGLMNSERKIVSEIVAALKRIEEGTYGVCEGTGNPIPRARLEANPWARYGVEYASQFEKGQTGLNYAIVRGREGFLDDDDSDDEDSDHIDEDVEYDLDQIEDKKEDMDEQDDEEPDKENSSQDQQDDEK